MDITRIRELLAPFVAGPPSDPLLNNISTYIDILLRWNARMNLTAVRTPDQIVTRHFGESLFAARHLFPAGDAQSTTNDCVDVGSGAGFPGLPIKLWAPGIRLTLIESNQKKATFLREVVRALTLTNINVFPNRAEDFPAASAQLVTLRAVESFETILPLAANLIAPGGRLALLIGQAQASRVPELVSRLAWSTPHPIPLSTSRILLIGQ